MIPSNLVKSLCEMMVTGQGDDPGPGGSEGGFPAEGIFFLLTEATEELRPLQLPRFGENQFGLSHRLAAQSVAEVELEGRARPGLEKNHL